MLNMLNDPISSDFVALNIWWTVVVTTRHAVPLINVFAVAGWCMAWFARFNKPDCRSDSKNSCVVNKGTVTSTLAPVHFRQLWRQNYVGLDLTDENVAKSAEHVWRFQSFWKWRRMDLYTRTYECFGVSCCLLLQMPLAHLIRCYLYKICAWCSIQEHSDLLLSCCVWASNFSFIY